MCDTRLRYRRGGRAGAVVRVRGIPESDHSFVYLVVACIELRQARGAADHQWQDTRGDRIERAQVPHSPGLDEPAHLAHHVMRSPAFGLVDYNDPVQLIAFLPDPSMPRTIRSPRLRNCARSACPWCPRRCASSSYRSRSDPAQARRLLEMAYGRPRSARPGPGNTLHSRSAWPPPTQADAARESNSVPA